jgi:glutamate carboxypeptidase
MKTEPQALRAALAGRHDRLAGRLLEWVAAESPTTDKLAVDMVGALVATELRAAGLCVALEPRAGVGDLIRGRLEAGPERILVLGHLDTVHPLGSVRLNPPRREAGKIWGPGAHDMKGGIAALLGATEALGALGLRPRATVEVLLTSDEETGSDQSRERILELARGCAAVLVLEPPLAGGALKTRRKGVGQFRFEVTGKAAHAGVDPESGVSAIREMAHLLLAAEALSEPAAGLSVRVGTVRGGSRPNVVPDFCEAVLDLRCRSAADGERVGQALRALEPQHPQARLRVSGAIGRPPLEATPANRALFQRACRIAGDAGLQLSEGETGGGSDGSFTSAAGVATLDGLGPDGAGLHSSGEYVLEDSLLERALLLALLLRQL